MGIFRSEAMEHGTLIIPTDRAVEIVTLLGERGEVMIQDMNATSMRRPYRRFVQRIEEIERELRYLQTEISKLPGAKIIAGDFEHFLEYDGFVLDGVEESLKTLADQFVKFRANNDDLALQRTRAVMNRAVAKVAAKSLGTKSPENLLNNNTTAAQKNNPSTQALLTGADPEQQQPGAPSGSPSFSAFAGVVKQEDVDKLTRTIFRATRGNAFTYYEVVDDEDAQYLVNMDLGDGTSGGVGGGGVGVGGGAATTSAATTSAGRNVFVVYYPGGEGSAMHDKIGRICKAFGIETFEWCKSSADAVSEISALTEVIEDKTKALEAFEEYFFDEVAVLLQPVHPGGNSLIEDWRLFCMKQKAIYGCLNLFEETDSTLRADCWYPAKSDEKIREVLRQSTNAGAVSAFLLTDTEGTVHKNPPTFTKTNEFTECFQNMVDTYGLPRYQEANPALLTTVTFPFMFGVMYGDVGHGILVAIFGFLLILYQNKKNQGVTDTSGGGVVSGTTTGGGGGELSGAGGGPVQPVTTSARVGGDDKEEEALGLLVYGRFMIFMMGLFAIYAGFLYNDFFSLGFNIYGSRYKVKTYSSSTDSELVSDLGKSITRFTPNYSPDLAVSPENPVAGAKRAAAHASFPYPFGFDPVWKDAENELDMLNSYKMKLSVIIGYLHMMLGICHKGLNSVYFRDHLTLWFEFIPQFIFLTCFVGYMDLLIVMKWCQEYYGQTRASIISTMINMAMMKTVTEENQYYDHQQKVERILLLIIVICIPWMLLPKPIIAKIMWDRRKGAAGGGVGGKSQGGGVGGGEEEGGGLIMITEGQQDGGAAAGTTAGGVLKKVESTTAGGEEEEGFEFGEEFIHQTIETIEFVLGSISNTASYLRLWALSLAHQQLAAVFFEQILLMIIKAVVKEDGGIANAIESGIAVFFGFACFAVVTFAIMLCMDTLECYLHALRLHWMEFQNKFYKADGYKFIPFSFYRILTGADIE